MNYEEAIEELKSVNIDLHDIMPDYVSNYNYHGMVSTLNEAIRYAKEYHKLTTPMKTTTSIYGVNRCPVCGAIVVTTEQKHCIKCGQRITL